jgi:hypothetical protein
MATFKTRFLVQNNQNVKVSDLLLFFLCLFDLKEKLKIFYLIVMHIFLFFFISWIDKEMESKTSVLLKNLFNLMYHKIPAFLPQVKYQFCAGAQVEDLWAEEEPQSSRSQNPGHCC